jgi:hypothetical protein
MVEVTDDPELDSLIEAGHLLRRGPMVVLTPAGKAAHAEWARLETGSDELLAAEAAYQRFLQFDKQVKRLTTEWQLSSGNSRKDGYTAEDWDLIDRLGAAHEKAAAVVSVLGRAVPRFAGYPRRLRQALQHLEDGDRAWFSGITCDSYHLVWWQLHEDLLLALGVPRSEDPNQ